MEIHTPGTLKLPASVLTIGALDGIHRGHQKLLLKTREQAEKFGVPFVVYTFNPPPKVYFKRCQMLTSLEEKLHRLKIMGAEHVIIGNFDEAFTKKEASIFLDEIGEVNPVEIWEGPDFQFGKNREGNVDVLRQYFNVGVLHSLKCEQGEVISSSRIRKLLKKENYFQAKKLLGEEIFTSSIIETEIQKAIII